MVRSWRLGYKYILMCCATCKIGYNQFMIKSFKHKGLQLLFDKGSVAGINAAHKSKLIIRLVALDTANVIEDMNLPGFRLHPLKGNKEGLWAIDVNKNWRITFEFRDGDAYILDYEDYH